MHTLYSKILFVGIGLLSVSQVLGQDSLTVVGGDCETFKKMEKDNIYKDNKIFSGYYIKCDKNNKVVNVQLFEKGKFNSYVEMKAVDSVLNEQIKMKNLKSVDHCHPDFNKITLDKPLIHDGYFKNGQFTGKKYIYDENGLISKIEIWKNGKYVGDAQVD